MSKKLYRVNLRTLGVYKTSYVVTVDPNEAYKKVRAYLDNEDLCFSHQRELDSVELLAEEKEYPECGMHLFMV